MKGVTVEKKNKPHSQNKTDERRILIVDDDEDYVISLVDILDSKGYIVKTAHSKQDANKRIQDFDAHLALIDIRLGSSNGISLISKFKSVNPAILCVMMTAYADIDTSIRALKTGAYDYLRKPIETHDLLATIDRCFERIYLEAEKSAAVGALRKSELRFRTLVENIPGVVYRCEMDDNWTMHYISDMIKVVSGYPASDFVANSIRPFISIIHPDDREIVKDTVYKAVKRRISFSVEYRITSADESVKWISESGQGVFTEDGNLQFLDGLLFDITERKRAEEALQSLATTFSTITGDEFFNKVTAHLATTLNMDYAFVGELIEKEDKVKVLGGFGKGQKLEPFEYDLADTPCENVMGQSLCYYLQGVSEQFPKDLFLAEMGIEGYIGAPLFNKSGKALGIMVVLSCKPITSLKITENLFNIFDNRVTAEIERRQAEIALQESETKFRKLSQEFHTLLDAIDDPMIQISPELKILWANRNAATFSGKDISSLQGQYCYKLWFNRSTPCDDCPAIVKCFQTGETGSIQFSTTDGRFCNLKASPVKDEEGKVRNVIEIYSDITKEIIMQEESTRAAQLATLGELAASVAHEINNPVYGITMCAQSLLADFRDNKIKDYDIINMILKESSRIANVTRCLLSFVRDSDDNRSLSSIHEILSDTLTITGVIIQKEGIILRKQIPKDLPLILASPQRIQQVFLNILNNARYTLNEKYPDTNENKIIEITGKEIMIDGCPHNQIIFYDRGMGIAIDKTEKALNPFFTTKPRGKGTGLGLSISNNIIKDHNGKLEIDSVQGEFTKMIITLPVAR